MAQSEDSPTTVIIAVWLLRRAALMLAVAADEGPDADRGMYVAASDSARSLAGVVAAIGGVE